MNPRHFKELTGSEKHPRFFRKKAPAKIARAPRRARDPRAAEARALHNYQRERRVEARRFFRSDLFYREAELDSTLKGKTHRGESFDNIYQKYLYGEF